MAWGVDHLQSTENLDDVPIFQYSIHFAGDQFDQ
jgi:hypothetical protein